MNHQQICGRHNRYPTTLPTSPCSRHVVGEAVLAYSPRKSTHEQLYGSLHLYEHLLYKEHELQVDLLVFFSNFFIQIFSATKQREKKEQRRPGFGDAGLLAGSCEDIEVLFVLNLRFRHCFSSLGSVNYIYSTNCQFVHISNLFNITPILLSRKENRTKNEPDTFPIGPIF